MNTQVTTTTTQDTVILYRLIDTRYYKIEFNKDVTVADTASYFSIDDELFKKLGQHYK
jgi:hypothetical protein